MRGFINKLGTFKAYYALAKPGIIYGNAIAALAGFFLASAGIINFVLLFGMLFGVCFVMASACVFNNYIDRDIDIKMERTKKRALVHGDISPKNALIFASILLILGFAILIQFTNWITVLVGIIGFVDYVIVYGYFKRKTYHATLIGSISGATPPVAGYVAVTGSFNLAALFLFLILLIWQMPHFYAIAIFRLKDYKNAGVPVLPAVKGIKTTKIVIFLYMIAFIPATLSLAIFGYAGYIYAAIMLILGLIWLKTAYDGFKMNDDVRWARKIFKYSLIVLLVFCVTISINFLLI